MLPKVCEWTAITFTKNHWILSIHSNFTNKNVSWLHFSWATQYIDWHLDALEHRVSCLYELLPRAAILVSYAHHTAVKMSEKYLENIIKNWTEWSVICRSNSPSPDLCKHLQLAIFNNNKLSLAGVQYDQ